MSKKKVEAVTDALRSIKRTCSNRQSFGYWSCFVCQYKQLCDECFQGSPREWVLPTKKRGKK